MLERKRAREIEEDRSLRDDLCETREFDISRGWFVEGGNENSAK